IIVSMSIGIGAFVIDRIVFLLCKQVAPETMCRAKGHPSCQIDHNHSLAHRNSIGFSLEPVLFLYISYAFVNSSMLLPLNIFPESSARKKRISAKSSGVISAFKCGAA